LRTKQVSALLALVEDKLHGMRRQTMKNRGDSHYRYSAIIADRRWKLDRNVIDSTRWPCPKHAGPMVSIAPHHPSSNGSGAGLRRSHSPPGLFLERAGGLGTRALSAESLMAVCDVCGNDYDKAFQVTQSDKTMTFDSFECAIHAMARTTSAP
jgi:hypothetical protein